MILFVDSRVLNILGTWNCFEDQIKQFQVYNINEECHATFWPEYTVVKRGHTEGIGREKTSSQKSTVIAFQLEWQVVLALESITLKSKLPRTLPSNYKLPLIFEKMNSF